MKAPIKRFVYRQLMALFKYTTFPKLSNLILSEFEKRCKTITPGSKPYIAVIDITNICNLHCYHCPTGKKLYGRKPGYMEITQLKKFLDEVGKYLYLAHLYSWGEPLLHPRAPEMIELVKSYKVSTLISTNLNTKNKNLLEQICETGIDYLTLSIDGSSQEVYSKYRIGGNLDLVLENIAYIVNYKKKKKLFSPIIEWQFLVFDHNRHEVETARQMAKKLGVDIFNAKPGIVPKDFHKGWGNCRQCPFLWNSIALQTDGGVTACCNFIDKKDDFGDLTQTPIDTIWCNSTYQEARRLFSPRHVSELSEASTHPCLYCSLVRNQPHLHEYLKKNKKIHIKDGISVHGDDTISVRSKQETEDNYS